MGLRREEEKGQQRWLLLRDIWDSPQGRAAWEGGEGAQVGASPRGRQVLDRKVVYQVLRNGVCVCARACTCVCVCVWQDGEQQGQCLARVDGQAAVWGREGPGFPPAPAGLAVPRRGPRGRPGFSSGLQILHWGLAAKDRFTRGTRADVLNLSCARHGAFPRQ